MARERIVDCDSGGIVASVFETTEAIEEDLENVSSLFVRVEIQIREDSTHSVISFAFAFEFLFQSFRGRMRGKKRKGTVSFSNFDSDLGVDL